MAIKKDSRLLGHYSKCSKNNQLG